MEFINNKILAIAVILFFNSVWSMKENRNETPVEVWTHIFQFLDPMDLKNVFLTSKAWNQVGNASLEPWVEKRLGPHAKPILEKPEIRKDFLFRWPQIAAHVLKMPSWTKTDIDAALSNESYSKSEEVLIRLVELKTIIIALKQEDIGINNWFLSIMLAHSGLNIRTAGSIVISYCAPGITFMDDLSVAMSGCNGVASHLKLSDVQDKACSVFKDDISNAIDVSMGAIAPLVTGKPFIKPSSHVDYNKDLCKLIRLYVLAFISQNECEKYLLNVYAKVKEALDNGNFDKSKEGIQEIFNIYMEDKKEPNNPYTQSLKRIAKTLANVSRE
jgi:hypothetical protein